MSSKIKDTLISKRNLRELNNDLKETGVSDIISHDDFLYIFDFMSNHSASRIIVNTTISKNELPSMVSRRDGDTIIFSPFFDKAGLDDVNMIISKDNIFISCIEDAAFKFYEKKGMYVVLKNIIDQLKDMQKAFNLYEKALYDEKEKDNFLSSYNLKLDHISS